MSTQRRDRLSPITTLTGASAAVSAIKALRSKAHTVRSLQDYYAGVETGA